MPSAPPLGATTTAALSASVPAKVVSERLGHANIAITMDTDSHCSVAELDCRTSRIQWRA
jgi:integrase